MRNYAKIFSIIEISIMLTTGLGVITVRKVYIIMGVISMQMMYGPYDEKKHHASAGIRRQQRSLSRYTSSSSMQVSKKRRLAVYPPKQYPVSHTSVSTIEQSSRRSRRFSSPSSRSITEGRPPRHPDSPISTSSSLPTLLSSGEWNSSKWQPNSYTK